MDDQHLVRLVDMMFRLICVYIPIYIMHAFVWRAVKKDILYVASTEKFYIDDNTSSE